MTVHSRRKSEVGQREQRPTLTDITPVKMARRNQHTGAGITFADFQQFATGLGSETVSFEKLFQCHVFWFSIFLAFDSEAGESRPFR